MDFKGVVMDREHDRHHVWFERAAYRTRLERKLRMHRGFVVPSLIEVHRELHAHVPPPPKPNHHQIAGLLDHMDEADPTPMHTAIEYFEELATRNGIMSIDAAAIADNLHQQGEYLWNVTDSYQRV